ncbi:MAG: glycosyltransferase family 4 protein [Zoogloea sp.]|nr:glycosyltransferase family 4 protein [Zoogloea sp.]
MRLLTFTTLYPSSARPAHGIFVETRLRHLLKTGRVEARVVAPVPWFPWRSARFGRYAGFARTPLREVWNGLEVFHPRYPLLPRFGMSTAPLALALASIPAIERIRRQGFEFDLIDAHYFYPDGVAAALLARHFGKPLTVTARGTDLNLIAQFRLPRRMIRWAAQQAARSISVCTALQVELEKLGVERERLVVLRNGVDLERFVPVAPRLARCLVGLSDRLTFASVGHLVERKGHEFAIRALVRFPGAQLVVVGCGELRGHLQSLAEHLGLAERVIFAGAVRQERLKLYYSAADVLILASSREGWPNVLLESMACGTPVVATRVWGSPEVVRAPEAGVLVDERSESGIAGGIAQLLANQPQREATRRYAERFSWDETVQGLLGVFEAMRVEACVT